MIRKHTGGDTTVVEADTVVYETANVTDVTHEDYGATGDGVTDDRAAIDEAQAADTTGVVYFPAGTYAMEGNGLIVKIADGGTLRGAGMYQTTIKSLPGITNWLAQTSASYPRQNITIEDMCFDTDGNGLGGLLGYGEHIQGLTIRRCRFLCPESTGVALSAFAGVTLEDCEFHGYATDSLGMSISDGCEDVVVRRCTFRYCESHITVGTGAGTSEHEDTAHHLTVEDSDFDMGWWAWPSLHSNSGATVSYSASVLTDSAGGFTALGVSGVLNQYDTARVLEVRSTGTIDTVTQNYLTDATGTFSNVLKGDLVRSGTKFAYAVGAKSATNLRVEEWLDSTTYLPTTPPADGATYTLYMVISFRVNSWTNTTVTAYDGFYDLDGVVVTPSAQALYEFYHKSNYNLHVGYSGANVRVVNNKVRRGWSDQISIYCNRAEILGNLVEDGEDMSITLNGTSGIGRSLVVGNTVRHGGGGGIFTSATNALIANNVLERCSWVNHTNLYTLGGIMLWGANDVLVSGNVIDGGSLTTARVGISLHTDTGLDACSNISIADNQITDTSVAGIVFYGTNHSGIQLRNNRSTISYLSGAVGVDSGTLYHTDLAVVGTPEGAVTAAINTTFRASTGTVYFKASGTGNTGWVALSGTNSGDITLATVGAVPAAAGASLSGQVLTLQPASATHAGVLSNTTQSIAGAKTFTGALTASSTFAGSSTVTGDTMAITQGALLMFPNAGNPSASTIYNGMIRRVALERRINYGSFAQATTVANILAIQVPSRCKIVGAFFDVTTKFIGGGVTAATLSFGTTAGAADILVAADIFTAAVFRGDADAHLGAKLARATSPVPGGYFNWAAAFPNIYATVTTTTANANALTQGVVDLYIVYETF